jgi:two-component system NarL family sensor kinase
VQWGAVAVAVVLLGAAAIFTVWRFVTPAGCAWLGPEPAEWALDHVVPRASPDCELPPGQEVVAARESPGLIRYRLSSGDVVVVSTHDHPAPVLRRLIEGAVTIAFTLAQLVVCVLLFIRRPAERSIGAAVIFSAGMFASTVVTIIGLPPPQAFDGWLRWLFLANTHVTYSLAWGAMLLLVVLFPTPVVPVADRLRTRVLIALGPLLILSLIAITVWVTTENFLALADSTMMAQLVITVFTILVAGALILVRMIRLRGDHGDAVARQQFLWVAGSALAAAMLGLSLWFVPGWLTGATILPADLIGMPGFLYVGALWIAVARFRLFEWEGVLVWTLVHTVLTLVAVAAFAVILLVVGAARPSFGPATTAVLAVILVAAVAAPIRDRIQQAVNFIVYRDPDNAYRTLSRVADGLAGRSVDFDRLAEDIRRALRIPRLAIHSARHTVNVGQSGDVPGSVPRSYPLQHGEHSYGDLVVHSRGRGDRFSPQERMLLRDLARQVAVALHEEALAGELQHSRERLVQAREEERRALRRALHDEVAPSVAGISLQAETVRQLMARDPTTSGTAFGPAVADMLDRIGHEAQQASRALRGLAYDLRPPALDERGLIAAIRDHGVRLAPTRVELEVIGLAVSAAATLPAAVEVAAYRIITGAMNNVAQHARAEHCWIRLERTPDQLLGEVTDDGDGLTPEARPGVGTLSMRERAAELGGTVTIGPRDGGGTVVTVRLPMGGSGG